MSANCADARSGQRKLADEYAAGEIDRNKRKQELSLLRNEVELLPKLVAEQEALFSDARLKLDKVANEHMALTEKFRQQERTLDCELEVYEAMASIRIEREHGSLKYIFKIGDNIECYMLMSVEVHETGKYYRLLDCRPLIQAHDAIMALNEGKFKIGGYLAVVRRRFKRAVCPKSALQIQQNAENQMALNIPQQEPQPVHQSNGMITRGAMIKSFNDFHV